MEHHVLEKRKMVYLTRETITKKSWEVLKGMLGLSDDIASVTIYFNDYYTEKVREHEGIKEKQKTK